MQTPTGSPPDMVAVGSKRFVPGPLAHHCANPQVVVPMTQCWHPRAGRGQDYTLWDDSLLDALARVGLSRESIYEQPPSEPKGFSLDAERILLSTLSVARRCHLSRGGSVANASVANGRTAVVTARSARTAVRSLASCRVARAFAKRRPSTISRTSSRRVAVTISS
jgi:hypothetical protein